MLPKNIRDLKQEAKKNCAAMKRVIKKMDDYLASSNPDAICVASAFFKALEYHIEHGDLKPENLTLSTWVQCCSKCEKYKPDDTKETCTQNEETSTDSSDVSMQSKCRHQENFDACTVWPTKRCIKCGEFYV